MSQYVGIDLFAGLGGSSQGAVETGRVHIT